MITTWYHGTSEEAWESIQKEGILFGKRKIAGCNISRCTYLAVDLEEAKCCGPVVLEVNYDPIKDEGPNNYCDGCWQIRVYAPIAIEKVKRVI